MEAPIQAWSKPSWHLHRNQIHHVYDMVHWQMHSFVILFHSWCREQAVI